MGKFHVGDWVEVISYSAYGWLAGSVGKITFEYGTFGGHFVEYEIYIEEMANEGPYRRVFEKQLIPASDPYKAACLKLGEDYFA